MKIGRDRKTKIVATIGPATSSYEMLLKIALAGVDVFRLNFSHGSHDVHRTTMEHISRINQEYNVHLSILADLQGPKLRVGEIENNHLDLEEGQILTFVHDKCVGNAERVYMSYPRFAQDVEIGEKVLVDDGKVELEVVETNRIDTVKLKVLFGSVLSSNKGVNLPQTNISLPSLTKKDKEDLDYILTRPEVNWIALSFVRHANDMHELRKLVQEKGHGARILAKIEKPEAIENIDAIIEASDAIMVARGDLGIEVPMERLPLLQKIIVRKCIERAKPVIVATQMMDSMITNPSPTRAEVTDVANAVFNGADAVMLSGETSVGRHPERVVEAMGKIIENAELHSDIYHKGLTPNIASPTYISDAICYNACTVAKDINAKMIIGMTQSGYTGFLVSSCRPNCSIIMFSGDAHLLNTLNLVWGIRGKFYNQEGNMDETVDHVQKILIDEGMLSSGDVVINTGRMPLPARQRTNMMKVSVIE
jgi:pyruvate kinase